MKSFAYIEFESVQAAKDALQKNDTLFKGRQLTVVPKRKNEPNRGRARRADPMQQMMQIMMSTFHRGRGMRGRGRGFDPSRGRGRGRGRGGGGPAATEGSGLGHGNAGEPKVDADEKQ